MSFEFNNAVQKLRPLSNKDTRLIIWYLADHASNPDEKGYGIAYASYETLMKNCQIKSRTTVNEGLQELESLGIIKKIHRPNQCVKYVLSMTAIHLYARNDLCLTPACDGEFYKNLDGLALCRDCYDRVSGSIVERTTEILTVRPAILPGISSDVLPGVSRREVGSTSGDTLSICIPSEESSIGKEYPLGPPLRSDNMNGNLSTQTPQAIADKLRICRHSQLASACKKCIQIEETRVWVEAEL